MINSSGLRLSLHQKAPLFQKDKNPGLILKQLIKELGSKNFSTSENLRDLYRQAGFVSLYFFLKCIAGFSGPYDRLNLTLHKDVCNFYQEIDFPGSRAFILLPRGHCKSKIGTEGGSAWDGLRDPNITIHIANATAEMGARFMSSVERIFDSNPLFKWLYPEYVPEPNSKRWNDNEMVLPNRTKHQREATVSSGGIGGSGEGQHYQKLKVDDMFGLKSLNAMRQSGAEMEKAKTWFKTQTASLLDSPSRSQVLGLGTRYAVDDGYNDILLDAKRFYGTEPPGYTVNPEGSYNVYYRAAIEDGEPIFPEDFNIEFYRKLAKDDSWAYHTQYMNNPSESGLTEFNMYEIKECTLDYDDKNKWVISYFLNGEFMHVLLKSCDVVIACDPAATERYYSAKTSQTAVGVLAHAPDNKKFLIALNAGYVAPSVMFNWIFSAAKKFRHMYRRTLLEAQGPFKVLGPIINDEQNRRNGDVSKEPIYLNLHPVSKVGEKDSVIRSTMEPELEHGNIYVEKHYIKLVQDQMMAFPQSSKKDILDMMCLALSHTIRPLTKREEYERSYRHDRFKNRKANAAGY